MLKRIRQFVINMLTGATVATVLSMLAVAYSDRISPADFPLVGCLGMVFPFTVVANVFMLLLMLSVAWKRTWIVLAGFALAYVPIHTYLPLNFVPAPQEPCLRLVSYNVCGYGGNFKYDQALDTIASYLQQADADIVCLQEDMSHKFQPVERFKAMYPYNDTIHLNESKNKQINALGIHSRYPIVKKERIDYRSYANGSVAFYLKVDEDTVIVINNHLEHTHLSKDDREHYEEVIQGKMSRELAEEEATAIIGKLASAMALRAPQADAIHAYIEAHKDYPMIVCGDFNDTPISYSRHTIAQGLTDCFATAGKGLGLSYNRKGFNLRIDHVLCSSHFVPQRCFIDSKMDASDHYPVVCWLKKVDNS